MQAYPWAAGYITEQAQLLDRLMSLKEQEIELQRALVSMQQSHLRVRQAQMMNLLHYQSKHGRVEDEGTEKVKSTSIPAPSGLNPDSASVRT